PSSRSPTALTFFFFFSSRRRHTRSKRDWSSDVCSSDLSGGSDGGELPWTGTDSTLPLLGGGACLLAAGGAMATAAHLRRKKAADAESGETAVDEPSGD